jgi:hypothetical protein
MSEEHGDQEELAQAVARPATTNSPPRRTVAAPRQVEAAETCEFSTPQFFESEWTQERLPCRLEHLGQNASHRVTYAETGPGSAFPVDGEPPFIVPDDSVFVLGDHRTGSRDSRAVGPIPLDAIEGTANFVWWSAGADGVRWSRLGKRLR